MFKTSIVSLLILSVVLLLAQPAQAQSQNLWVVLEGDNTSTAILKYVMGYRDDNPGGFHILSTRDDSLNYVIINCYPLNTQRGSYSTTGWNVNSSILSNFSDYRLPYLSYGQYSYSNGVGTIMQYTIKIPVTKYSFEERTYLSGGFAKYGYKSKNFGAVGFSLYKSGGDDYNLAEFSAKDLSVQQVVGSLTSELASISQNTAYSSPPTTIQTDTGYTTPTVTGYTPPPTPAPRANIEFSDSDHNSVSFDQLNSGDTIDIYSATGAISFRSGASFIKVTPGDFKNGWLEFSRSSYNFDLPATDYEINKTVVGQYKIIIQETRYESLNIKTIYLNFLDQKTKIKNDEINF